MKVLNKREEQWVKENELLSLISTTIDFENQSVVMCLSDKKYNSLIKNGMFR